MTVKTAAVLAFVGTVLAAVLLVYNLVTDIAGVVRGLIPAARLFAAVIYAFAAVVLAIFFYAFQKQHR
jgi:predicted Co/Zn/Cd cation transporter (cation efflux family)